MALENFEDAPGSPACTTDSTDHDHTSDRSPCAACKFLRRKCIESCIFAPYFPQKQHEKFIIIHKIFGASNLAKLLSNVSVVDRSNTVNSLAYEAQARTIDPVYGCVGAVGFLQQQLTTLQAELATTKARLAAIEAEQEEAAGARHRGTKRPRSADQWDQLADLKTLADALCPLPEPKRYAQQQASDSITIGTLGQTFLDNFDLPIANILDSPLTALLKFDQAMEGQLMAAAAGMCF